MAASTRIKTVEVWQVRIPLARPYHLSKLYGTLTHSDAALLRVTLENGECGWGEADPGGVNFDGETIESVMRTLQPWAREMIGSCVADWASQERGRERYGAAAAAIDVACFDALACTQGKPVCELLGTRLRECIASLWPTSSGSADDDLDVIAERQMQGFNTYMLKMGDRAVREDIARAHDVAARLPTGVRFMVDANQGWQRDEAILFARETADLPIILIEQPVRADDHDGLVQVREAAASPVSVDESIQCPTDASKMLEHDAADVFSIKISKNGGLANSRAIANIVGVDGKRVLMNSMIELGITQAASLQLGCTLDNLVDCGHAYMSTLRMADDVTDFSTWIKNGTACLPDSPGLGVTVSMEKIEYYKVDQFNVS